MTDQDGFAWAASFTKFAFSAQGTPDRFYTAAVIGPGGPANSIAYARAASGYLVSKASIGTTDSWTPGCGDGHPANKWTVERMDGPGTDPTKMTDSSKIEYIAQFFDNDNVPTKVITNSSEIDTTYQKTLHPDRKDAWWTTLGWAAQMPAEVDTKGFDANGGPMTTVEKIALSQGGTNGGAYTVTVTEPWTGGDAVTEYDQFSRVIASQGPGDVPGVWRTITYDQFGQVSKQVDNASEVDSVSYASGNRKSVTVTACGKQRLSVTATENQYKVINSTTIVVGDPNGKGSYTKSLGQDKFDTNGLAATTTLTTPVYSREEDRTFSLGVLTGVTQTTTVGGTPYTEQRAWHVRGY
jgi:hypothetical protein